MLVRYLRNVPPVVDRDRFPASIGPWPSVTPEHPRLVPSSFFGSIVLDAIEFVGESVIAAQTRVRIPVEPPSLVERVSPVRSPLGLMSLEQGREEPARWNGAYRSRVSTGRRARRLSGPAEDYVPGGRQGSGPVKTLITHRRRSVRP
jgi:hypothetical protein